MSPAPIFCRALPREVFLAGQFWPIETDFRPWVLLSEVLADEAITPEEKAAAALAMYRQQPRDIARAMEALLRFYRLERPLPKVGGSGGRGEQPFSYAADGTYVVAAFRQAYGMDLCALPYLHWWEFCALLWGLPEDCALKRRIALRQMDVSQIKHPAERQRILALKQQVALPMGPMTDTEIGNALWAGGD